jgi:hypothetical protein
MLKVVLFANVNTAIRLTYFEIVIVILNKQGGKDIAEYTKETLKSLQILLFSEAPNL